MPIKITYFIEDEICNFFKKCIFGLKREFDNEIKNINRVFCGNEQWEFYEKIYSKEADKKVDLIVGDLLKQFPEIKEAISNGELASFFKRNLLYRLTFGSIPLLILTNEAEGKLEFQPRNITLKSAVGDKKEMDSLVGLADQEIARLIRHYKNHRCIACIEIANAVIDDNLNWEFANVNFHLNKDDIVENHYSKWINEGETDKNAPNGIFGSRADLATKSAAIIKFEGCSAYKALIISLSYFNKVFNILRLIAELKLKRHCFITRESLELSNKVISLVSKWDNPMWSSITPSLDNDFYVAIKENSIYLPLLLSQDSIKIIENYEDITSMLQILKRAFKDEDYPIDKNIFDSLSWFSESLKNFIIPHKIIGFITALETILTDKNYGDGSVTDKTISELFSERGAIILKDTYEERLKIKKQLKEIYNLRSKIVHGVRRVLIEKKGKVDFYVLESEEEKKLLEIQHLAAEIISKVISLVEKEKIKTIEELNSYIERKLLS